MKRLFLSVLMAVGLCTAGYSQVINTNTSPPTIGGPVTNVISFLSETGTNWMFVPFGITYENKEGKRKAGGGIGAFYKVSDFVLTGIRFDVLDELYMPSGNIQLQVPFQIGGKVKVTPFGFAGVATAISHTSENEPVLGIFGAGMAVNITKNLYIVGDVEVWTGFPGEQYRAGLVWKF